MPEHRPRRSGRLWTDPREEDEQQPWLATPTRIEPTPSPAGPPGPSAEEVAAERDRTERATRRRMVQIAAAVVVTLVVFLAAESLLDGDDGLTSAALPKAPPGAAPADERSRTVQAVYAAVSKSVVNIQVQIGGTSDSGTGFVVDGAGTIVTNAHVVGDADTARVRLDDNGRSVDAEIVGRDRSTDLAVLRVDRNKIKGIRPLALADSDKVRVGDVAIAIGYPLGLDRTATSGIVSGLGRQIEAPNGFSIDEVIQTDAPINPGNSGGPLLDSRGRVIGVNSQIATSGGGSGSVGIGFAVPSKTVREIIPRLKKGGAIKRAYLGVETAEATSGDVVLRAVTPGGPAEAAGLQAGDVIRAIDGNAINRSKDVVDAVEQRKPGQPIDLDVERGPQSATIKVQLGTRPERVR